MVFTWSESESEREREKRLEERLEKVSVWLSGRGKVIYGKGRARLLPSSRAARKPTAATVNFQMETSTSASLKTGRGVAWRGPRDCFVETAKIVRKIIISKVIFMKIDASCMSCVWSCAVGLALPWEAIREQSPLLKAPAPVKSIPIVPTRDSSNEHISFHKRIWILITDFRKCCLELGKWLPVFLIVWHLFLLTRVKFVIRRFGCLMLLGNRRW